MFADTGACPRRPGSPLADILSASTVRPLAIARHCKHTTAAGATRCARGVRCRPQTACGVASQCFGRLPACDLPSACAHTAAALVSLFVGLARPIPSICTRAFAALGWSHRARLSRTSTAALLRRWSSRVGGALLCTLLPTLCLAALSHCASASVYSVSLSRQLPIAFNLVALSRALLLEPSPSCTHAALSRAYALLLRERRSPHDARGQRRCVVSPHPAATARALLAGRHNRLKGGRGSRDRLALVVDSGCTWHIHPNASDLLNTRPSDEYVMGIDKKPRLCTAFGELHLLATDEHGVARPIVLRDVRCAPSFQADCDEN
eukprot:6213013-Pleurochrysis_carterae.AAC.1